MLETNDLVLDKAKAADWREMYYNVWSQPECAKYMAWRVTICEKDARIRICKTIEFQKTHDTYLVYEKASGKAIGFAGVEKITTDTYQEAGICLGTDYMRKGYGKQIVRCLIQYCKKLGAKEFLYLTRESNEAANALALSLGFTVVASEMKTDNRDKTNYNLLKYCLKL